LKSMVEGSKKCPEISEGGGGTPSCPTDTPKNLGGTNRYAFRKNVSFLPQRGVQSTPNRGPKGIPLSCYVEGGGKLETKRGGQEKSRFRMPVGGGEEGSLPLTKEKWILRI